MGESVIPTASTAPLHRIQTVDLCVGSVRGRGPAVRGIRVRQDGDERLLRTVLRHFTIETTTPGDKWHAGGLGLVPARGGRIVMHRRPADTPVET